MKRVILLILFLAMLPLLSQAQVSITGTANTGYYLQTADGDTLQLSGTTPFYNTYRSALEDALNYSGEYDITVYVRSNINERVNADFGWYDEPIYIEGPTDTVTVYEEVFITSPPDTVIEYVTVPPDTVTVTEVETVTETVFVTDTVFVDVPGETMIDTVTVTETVIETVTDTLFVEVPGETTIDTVTVVEMMTDTVTVTEEVYIELPADTVYVEMPPDTVTVTETIVEYIEVPGDTLRVPTYSEYLPDHNLMIKNISFDFNRTADTLTTGEINYTEFINFEIATQMLDTLYTEVRCGTEWVETNTFTQPADTLYYGLIWNCDSPLTYKFEAMNSDGWRETVTNTYPLFLTEAEQWGGPSPTSYYTDFANTAMFDSTWSLIWGNVVPTFSDNFLVLENPTRNISRLQWNQIPSHRNIRVAITEVIDSTHSTGIHMSMRTSQTPQENSVETYISESGFGISIFTNGSWSNPVDFPFAWEYGVPINYVVELVDDTIRAKAWSEGFPEPTEWWTYQSENVGTHPDGTFSVGSTGQGIYLLDQIDITILD